MGTRGAVAQLAERLHGMQEVTGSNPVSSTLGSALHPSPEFNLSLCLCPAESGSPRWEVQTSDVDVPINGVRFMVSPSAVTHAVARDRGAGSRA